MTLLLVAQTPLPGSWQEQNKKKKHLSQISEYKKGTGAAMVHDGMSATPARPEHMDNKCIVISRLRKDMSRVQFQAMIDATADRKIDYRHMESLSKEYSTWRTVAIELNQQDYDTLSNPNFWDPQLRIREFVGHKHWRGEFKPRLTIQQIRSSLKSQWAEE